ncbi:triose-phosphate isomerase [Kribbella pratensis]|jgi:triosephosphate isomerase|uniref:Triosephosphate isomerase n=1 Tax=Kribbella pratensis TaxID=2512112 RepID=A0A4R8CLM1_9ACTN|nr:triose-phosphate isomerase [Kribbella pratensis]TDW76952.1 triosephosphate isomerase [Kribbella pratensis]
MADAARTPLMAGNWKMNLNHVEAVHLLQKLSWTLQDKKHDFERVEVAVLPPFTDLRSVQTLVDGDRMKIKYGAQDVSTHDPGAYTGEIAASMLTKLGCTYVLTGHSERRQYHHETNELVNAKTAKALESGLIPIVCVGEGLEVRKANGHVEHCVAQIDAALAGIKADDVRKLVIAYEPVWAIGTGEVATPEDAQEVIAAIRGRLEETISPSVADSVRILYGGSVKMASAGGIMAQPDVDGCLVGGASLQVDEFAGICRYLDLQLGYSS